MSIPFARPCIGEEEVEAAAAAMRTGWLSAGPKVVEFEQAVQEYLNLEVQPVATGSCTVAMAAALGALGVGPGDAVFVPAITFPATANVVRHLGAEVVLCDVEPETLCLDPFDLEKRIAWAHRARLKPKVVMPVDLHGLPCDYDQIAHVARAFGLAVVVDAAHSFGARYVDKMVGAQVTELPWLTCFSFYATKNLTTGEGGMVTGPAGLLEGVRAWAMHGIDRRAWDRHRGGSWYFDVTAPGFKGNMTDPAAAMGLVQLRGFPAAQARRRQIVDRYNEGFKTMLALRVPPSRLGRRSADHVYSLHVSDSLNRDGLIEAAKAAGVGLNVHFTPLHELAAYRDPWFRLDEDLPVATAAGRQIVSLPLYPCLSDEDVDQVIEVLCGFL